VNFLEDFDSLDEGSFFVDVSSLEICEILALVLILATRLAVLLIVFEGDFAEVLVVLAVVLVFGFFSVVPDSDLLVFAMILKNKIIKTIRYR